MTTPYTYNDIDWLALWQNERQQRSWRSKKAKDWDKKAEGFARRTRTSPYVAALLARLPLADDLSVLDVGCGPGSLALPMARSVRKVTAVDYAEKMLSCIAEECDHLGITNIDTVHCAWEDDWHGCGIEPADIAIASRSLNVENLPAALKKLDSYARRWVFITDRITPSPFDPDAFAAIGRPLQSGPDYIYTLNFLYTMKIHANVEILQLRRHEEYGDMEAAFAAYAWMFKDLQLDEEHRLRRYLQSLVVSTEQDKVVLRRRHPQRWALIWWQKEPAL